MDYLFRRGEYADPARSPRPGLILLDLNLPGTDGREVLAAIKDEDALKTIPVIILTTSNAEEDVRSCYFDGASSYIQKPVDLPRFDRGHSAPQGLLVRNRHSSEVGLMATAGAAESLRVLIVEDNPEDRRVYERFLRADPVRDYSVAAADSGAEGLIEFAATSPDCILLDFNLPDMDGLEFLEELVFEGEDPPAAVVMLTGQGSERVAVEAMKRGVHDYLIKSDVDAEGMWRTISSAMDNVRFRRQRDADRQGLERMAFYDPLTGLGNRNLFRDRLTHALEVAKRNHCELGLLLLDLDRFKTINDSLGHQAGDATLHEVGRRLRRSLRKADTAVRLGGDEFGAVLETGVSFDGARAAARKIIESVRRPIPHGRETLTVGASIGIAMFPHHGDDYDALVHRADAAMYRAKRAGGGFAVFEGGELEALSAPLRPAS